MRTICKHLRKRTTYYIERFLPALLCLGLCGCSIPAPGTLLSSSREAASQAAAPLSDTALKFDTVVTLTLYDTDDSSILDGAMALCDRYEAIFSTTAPDSELYQLNHRELPAIPGQPNTYQLSAELSALLSIGQTYTKETDEALNYAIAPLTSLWDFHAESPQVPAEADITSALSRCHPEGVTLNGTQITLSSPDTQFDLGALAKGYIADRLKEYLISKDVHRAIISLGGNILCIGQKAADTPFTVGIQKPFGVQGEYSLTLKITDQSVVTSGIYQRYFEKDGQLYHHILDSQTGYPIDSSLASVTILSDASVDGDALSTACFALGLEDGLAYLASLPDIYGIFITKDGRITASEDLPSSYQLTAVS